MIDYPKNFRKFKNCNSVFIFKKIDNNKYKVTNKIKNGLFNYVKNSSFKKKIIEKKNILDFLNCYVYH